MPEFQTVEDFRHKISNFSYNEAKLNVIELKLGDATQIVDAFKARKDKTGQLQKLDLSKYIIANPSAMISPKDMKTIIDGIASLQTLTNGVTKPARLLETLETLDLSGNPLSEEIGESLINLLEKAQNLKYLKIEDAALKPEHHSAILDALSSRQAAAQASREAAARELQDQDLMPPLIFASSAPSTPSRSSRSSTPATSPTPNAATSVAEGQRAESLGQNAGTSR